MPSPLLLSTSPYHGGVSTSCPACWLSHRPPDSAYLTFKFLGNKIIFWTVTKREAAEADTSAAPAGQVPPAATGNKKKVRKMQQQQQQGGGKDSSGPLQPGYLYPDLLTRLEFTEDLECLVRTATGWGVRRMVWFLVCPALKRSLRELFCFPKQQTGGQTDRQPSGRTGMQVGLQADGRHAGKACCLHLSP